jgi:hypothetical protein
MKKIFTILVTATMVCCGNLFAKDIAASTSDFVDKWSSAENGDILVLAPGTYDFAYTLLGNKTVTLKGGDGGEVVFVKGPICDIATSDNSGLIMENLIIEFGGAFISLNTAITVKMLQFKNCIVRNSGADGNAANLLSLTAGTLEKIDINGCIVKNSKNDQGKNFFIYNKNNQLINMEVKNCTFCNLDYRGFYTQESDLAAGVTVLFENNTVSNWTTLNDYLINFYRGNSSSAFILRNNLFVADPAVEKSIFRTRAGTFSYVNNLTIGYNPYATTGIIDAASVDLDPVTLGLTTVSAIGFSDGANGIFTLPSNSPLRTAGTESKSVGDPRWAIGQTTGIRNPSLGQQPTHGSVYTIDGRLVKRFATDANVLDDLQGGIYIYNGKKIVVIK